MVGFSDLFGSGKRLSIDFGTSSLKLARLKSSSDQSIEFGLCGEEPVNLGDGEVVESYSQALQALLNRHNVSTNQKVMVSLPTDSTIVRHMELPAVEDERLSKVVEYEAESNIPFPAQSVVMDYHVLERTSDTTHILLVVIKKDQLENYISVLRKVDFQPEIIEISSFSLFNIYQKLRDRHSDDRAGAGVLVDVGHESTDLIIYQDETLRYARSASVGGQSMIEAIQEELDVDPNKARTLLHDAGHIPLDGPKTERQQPPSGPERPPSPPNSADEDSTGDDSVEKPPPPSPDQSAEETDDEIPKPPPPPGEESQDDSGEDSTAPPPPSPSSSSDPSESGTEDDSSSLDPPQPPDQKESKSDPSASDDQSSDADSLDLQLGQDTGNDDEMNESEAIGDQGEGTEEPAGSVRSSAGDGSDDEGSDLFLDAPEEEGKDNDENSGDALMGSSDRSENETQSDDENRNESLQQSESTDTEDRPDIPSESDEADETQGTDMNQGEESSTEDEESNDENDDDLGDLSLGNLRSPGEEENDDKNDLGAAANPSPDPPSDDNVDREAIGRVLKEEADRLIGELRQTFDYVQSEMSGQEIGEIILCGGTSKVKNLSPYIEGELDKTTRKFDPGRSLSGLDGCDAQSMLVAGGLGLRSTDKTVSVEINLIPESVREERKARKQQFRTAVLGVMALLLVAQILGWGYMKYRQRWNELQRSKKELRKVNPIVSRVNELEQIKKKLDTRLSIIQRLEKKQVRILPILDSLNNLPMIDNTWMVNLSINSNQDRSVMKLTGVTADYQNVSKFDEWMQSRRYVSKKVPNSQKQSRTSAGGQSMVQFNVSYVLDFSVINETSKLAQSTGSQESK